MSQALNFIVRFFSIFLISGLTLFFNNSVKAQDSTRFHVGFSIGFHPDDWRLFLHLDDLHKHWYHQVHLGIGVRKSIFQQNLNPIVAYSIGGTWNVKQFYFRPNLRLSYAGLMLPTSSSHRLIQNIETYGTGRIGYGISNSLFLEAGIGPAWEIKYDSYQARRMAYFHWTYFFQIGYTHAL